MFPYKRSLTVHSPCLASYTQRTFWSPSRWQLRGTQPFCEPESRSIVSRFVYSSYWLMGITLLVVENGVIVNTCVRVFGHLFSIRLVHTRAELLDHRIILCLTV